MANIDVTQVTLNSSPADDVSLLAVNGLEIQRVPVSSIKNNSSGSGSGGGSIIPVDALPTENIDANAIYKVTESVEKVELYYHRGNGEIQLEDDIFEIVDTLPETGTPCLDFVNNVPEYWYYQKSDGAIYGYADDVVASEGGVPVGWYSIEMVYDFIGNYKGMVYSTSDMTEEGHYALVTNSTKTSLYFYNTSTSTYEQLVTKSELNSSGGSGGGGASIMYATEKPSTPQQAIYVITEDEVVKADVYAYTDKISPDFGYCEIVDELPANPSPAVTLDATMSEVEYMYCYYLTRDNQIWIYADEIVGTMLQVPAGWYMGSDMGCVILNSEDEISTNESQTAVLLVKQPKTRVYVPMQDGTFLELTSGVRTRFDEKLGTVSITEV